MKDADPEVSGWVPDPNGGHDLRYIQNGVRTELVANDGNDVATDPSISRGGGFDWYGPDTDSAPRVAATSPDWLMPGTYVFRCRCSKGSWSRVAPFWYSPVWSAGRMIYLVDASSLTATHIAGGEAFSWRGSEGTATVFRDGSYVGSITGRWLRNLYPPLNARWLRDLNRQRFARNRRHKFKLSRVQSLDGTPIASCYWRRNPSGGGHDDTVVLTVTAELTDPLATLVLAWALTLPEYAHINRG